MTNREKIDRIYESAQKIDQVYDVWATKHKLTLYEMMMLGLRIALTEKSALNLSCGLEMNFGAYWSGGYALHIGYEF